ncbi:MAG: peptide deformylase, partial [Steroidobacteraceae bacterium]
MAKLTILEYPDPRLRTRAQPVAVVDDAVRRLVDDLFETMYAAKGIGLAATQVDVHQRVLVTDMSADRTEPRVFITAQVIERDGSTVAEEGCLSVPGIYDVL